MNPSTTLPDRFWVGGHWGTFSARLLFVLVAGWVCAACAGRGELVRVVVPPQSELDRWIGLPASEVVDRFGTPTATRPSPDGGRVLIFERIGKKIRWQSPMLIAPGRQGLFDGRASHSSGGVGGATLTPAIVPAAGMVSEVLAQFWIGSDDRVVRVEVHPKKFHRHLGRVRTLRAVQ